MEENYPESRYTPGWPGEVTIRSLKDAQAFSQINRIFTEELTRLYTERFHRETSIPNSNAWMITELFKVDVFLPGFVKRLRKLRECLDLGFSLELEPEGLEFLKENTVEILNILQNTHCKQ